MYGLKTEASFDSAHFLTDYYGKCENLHGHRWRAVVYLETVDLQTGGTMKDMVVDFGVFKRAVRDLAEELDHTFLVEEGSLTAATLAALEAEGFSLTVLPFRTTAENLARYVCERLVEQGLPVSQVDMYETPNNCASYRPVSRLERLAFVGRRVRIALEDDRFWVDLAFFNRILCRSRATSWFSVDFLRRARIQCKGSLSKAPCMQREEEAQARESRPKVARRCRNPTSD